MNLKLDKPTFTVAPYSVNKEQTHYILENLQTGEFFEMPEPAVEAIEALSRNEDPQEIERALRAKYPDEDINMSEFIGQLIEMKLVRIGSQDSGATGNRPAKSGIVNEQKPSWIGKLLFNPHFCMVYFALFLLNLVFFVWKPEYFPRYRDMFPFSSMVVNLLIGFALSFLLLIIHESGHVLAIKAHGQPTRVSFGHRLFLVVMETDMSYIWRLDRKQRRIPLLAGMCFDQTLLFIALLILLFVPGVPLGLTAVIKMAVLQLVMMTVYQALIFMKTDLYYWFENRTGCYNLMENAQALLTRRIKRTPHRNASQVIYKEEERTVRGFAVLYLCGLLLSGAMLIVYILPQMTYILNTSVSRLLDPPSTGMAWDAVIILVQMAVMLGLLVYSWLRKLAQHLKSTG